MPTALCLSLSLFSSVNDRKYYEREREKEKSIPYRFHINNRGAFLYVFGSFIFSKFSFSLYLRSSSSVHSEWKKKKENSIKIILWIFREYVVAEMVVCAAVAAVIIARLMGEWGKKKRIMRRPTKSWRLAYTIYVYIFSMVSPFVEFAWEFFAFKVYILLHF